MVPYSARVAPHQTGKQFLPSHQTAGILCTGPHWQNLPQQLGQPRRVRTQPSPYWDVLPPKQDILTLPLNASRIQIHDTWQTILGCYPFTTLDSAPMPLTLPHICFVQCVPCYVLVRFCGQYVRCRATLGPAHITRHHLGDTLHSTQQTYNIAQYSLQFIRSAKGMLPPVADCGRPALTS